MTRRLFPGDLVTTESVRDRIADMETDHITDDGDETDPALWPEGERRVYQGLAAVLLAVGGLPRDSVTLIHENHFETYIRELYLEIGGEYYEPDAEKFGALVHVPLDDLYRRMPFSCIDWRQVAEEEQSDYTSLEVDGATYLYLRA